MKNSAVLNRLSTVFIALMIVGCSGKESPRTADPAVTDVVTSSVVARVNGEAISEQDLQDAFNRTFSSAEALALDNTIQAKLLDSVIASRAIAQAAKKMLSAEDNRALLASVRLYQEELYIKAYLQQNVSPEPVSSALVEAYYNSHLGDFGQQEIQKIEFIRVVDQADEGQRDLLLTLYATLQTSDQWAELAEQNPALVYRQSWVTPGLLSNEIEQSVAGMAVDDVSSIVVIGGVAHVIRILAQRLQPAAPLSEVSAEIRKRLVPLQLRKAVKDVSEQLISEASVEIFD